MTFWQRVKRELGRETQPVDTVVRLIIVERAIVGMLVLVLGVALLTNSRGVVSLVRLWVSELDVNPERRVVPRILSTVLEKGRWKYFGFYCMAASAVVLILGLIQG